MHSAFASGFTVDCAFMKLVSSLVTFGFLQLPVSLAESAQAKTSLLYVETVHDE